MKLLMLAMALTATAPVADGAESRTAPLQLRPKMVGTIDHKYAPFVNPATDRDLDLMPRHDVRQESSRSSCAGQNALCYDPASGRIVYKPAREYMPDLPGLQRENISIKRDRIVFRYSF